MLTDELRQKRKDVAREMIPSLKAAFQEGSRNLITGDEFWFFLSPHEKKELIRPGFDRKIPASIEAIELIKKKG
jgi:hypothetical protein